MKDTKPTPFYELALETSVASAGCGGVALGQGGLLLDVRLFEGARNHAALMLPAMDELCRAHGASPSMVRHIYVSIGPGSFTGLRISLTAARMLAYSVGARVVGVPSLEVIAQNALLASDVPEHVAVILDAKRGRTYAASFSLQDGVYVPTTRPAEVEPAAFFRDLPRSCVVTGEGVKVHRAVVDASGLAVLPESLLLPRVETVYQLGSRRAKQNRFDDPKRLVPVYIRAPQAEEMWRQRNDTQTSPETT